MSPEQLAANAQQKMLNRRRKQKKCPSSRTTAPRISPTQQRGNAHEATAVNYLQQQGLTILRQNIACRFGEIDIVARHDEHLVFVEVRQRSSHTHGGALYSVQRDKQQRLKRTAQYFLSKICRHYFTNQLPFCRFDVLAIEGDTITWIPNAFH